MHGVLVVDKPRGPTSFDVVQQVREALGVKKAGHTGTLDPMATGVLAVCLGDATRVAQFIIDGDKSYEAVVRLGSTTDTMDAEGKVLLERPVPPVDLPTLEGALARFRGTLLQTPPMYSAVKVGGRRLYELARAGEEIERKPREVTVRSLTLQDFSATELRFQVTASKGFFVRVLASELGEALGCGAHLVALRRTASGRFTLAQAVPLAELQGGDAPTGAKRADRAERTERTERTRRAVVGRLVSIGEALGDLPEVRVSAEEAERVLHGGLVEARGEGLVRVLAANGELLALADVERGRLRYRRVLARSE